MDTCTGNGTCFKECQHPGVKHPKFFGGTSRRDAYCKESCQYNCQLQECKQYRFCLQKRPQHILDLNKGICLNCLSLDYFYLKV